MLNQPEPACLVIADISGYTSYLAGVELDHAQDILADLVDTVVHSLRPTFKLAKLEGDAAFAYVIVETVDGSLLQDVVERTYIAFRRRLRDIGRATSCECNACIRIPQLDLKFVVHHGRIVRQRMAGQEELVGRDVILVHRLLKNEVREQTGIEVYALYTADCIAAMGIDDPAAQGLRRHVETIDIIGEVEVWLRDLAAVWEAEQVRSAVEVRAEDAYRVYRFRTRAPRSLAWEFATSPSRRPQWGGMDRLDEAALAGRRGAGTVSHCVHGREVILEEVLDWRPYDYITTRSTLPIARALPIVMTDAFGELPDGGTEVELRVGKPRPRDRKAFEELFPQVDPMLTAMGGALVPALDAEWAAREAALADEPVVPASEDRFIREPVAAGADSVDSGARRSSQG